MQATIYWRTPEEGGRRNLPLGEGEPPYATLVHLKGDEEPWPPKEAWSLVVRKTKQIDPFTWHADVDFLVQAAPRGALISGKKFELYEGSKCVASGSID